MKLSLDGDDPSNSGENARMEAPAPPARFDLPSFGVPLIDPQCFDF